jgi:hypothetical protein
MMDPEHKKLLEHIKGLLDSVVIQLLMVVVLLSLIACGIWLK